MLTASQALIGLESRRSGCAVPVQAVYSRPVPGVTLPPLIARAADPAPAIAITHPFRKFSRVVIFRPCMMQVLYAVLRTQFGM